MTQSLHLTIVAPGNLPLHERVRSVTKGPFRIGRDDDNDWVIADPSRRLSRHHCTIDVKAGVFVVIDTSANGLVINNADQPLGRGNSAIINDGDLLHLACVSIKVALVATDDAQRDPFLAILPKAGFSGKGLQAASIPGAGLQGAGAADPLLDASRWGRKASSPSFPPSPPLPSTLLPWADEGPELLPQSPFAPNPWRKETEPDHVPAEMQILRPIVSVNIEIPQDWDAQDSFDAPPVSAFAQNAGLPAPRPPDAGAVLPSAAVLALIEALARIEKASGVGEAEALLKGGPETALANLARLDPEWAHDELLSLAARVADRLAAARALSEPRDASAPRSGSFRPSDGDDSR